MVWTNALACGVCLIAIGTSTAANGDTGLPTSLRMRPRPRGTGTAPDKRVAQSPAPDNAPDAGEPPAAAPPPEAAPPGTSEPSQAAPPAAARPDVDAVDFAKLAEQDFKEEVIVVTGSTIGRRTLTTSAPLTVIDREMLQASGQSTLGDIVQLLPAQQGAMNAQVNTGGDGATRVDVRGLTSARTLVLINGRRVVSSGNGADTSADLNAIPLVIVDRVEVLKDGASAIYGSDAIGGVVNIITRSEFEGNEASIYTGETQHGDGFTYEASFITGQTRDAKRANIVFAASIDRQLPIFAGSRGFASSDMTYDYMTRTVVPGGSTVAPGGRINTQAIDSNGDGQPDPVDLCGAGVQYCTSNGAGGYRPFTASDLYNPQPTSYLYTPSTRYHVFGTGSYKLTSHTETFFEAIYSNRKSAQQLAPGSFDNSVPISASSIYNPLGGTVLGYQRRLDEFGPRRSEENVTTFRIVTGLKGSAPDDIDLLKHFKWELSYNYGRSDADLTSTGNLISSRLAAAVGPSFINTRGVPTCGTQAKPIAGCVPMNVLGPSGSIDPAAAAYVTYTGVRGGFNEQQTALAQLHGQIAKLPHNGDVSLALGGDVRRESGGTTPDPLTVIGDTTGPATAPTNGAYNVVEGFGELSLVPISGDAIAQWLELNLAARAFRYNTFGSGVTWKAGVLFRTVDGIAIRSTYSTSFRAPSLSELYQGKTQLAFPLIDPCDTRPLGIPIMLDPNVAAECARAGVPSNSAFGAGLTRVSFGGNDKLEPETANVFTAGVVIEPPQAKGLAVTVDYFQTQISNTILPILPNIALANCYLRHVAASCDLIHRNPQLGYAIDFIDMPNQNGGGAIGAGIDAAVAYDHAFASAGRFREALEAQYLLKAELDNTFLILNALDNNDIGPRPRIRAHFSSLWQHPTGVGAGFNLKYIGTYHECEQNNCNGGMPARLVDDWYQFDVHGSYSLKTGAGLTSLTVGVNNVLDRDPPVIYGATGGNYEPTAYDTRGRFFYARMSQTF